MHPLNTYSEALRRLVRMGGTHILTGDRVGLENSTVLMEHRNLLTVVVTQNIFGRVHLLRGQPLRVVVSQDSNSTGAFSLL